MELEEAIKKLKKPKKIALITLIRQFKREGIENFVVTRPEIIETILNHLKQKEHELNYQKNYCTMVTESKDDIIKSMAERITKQEKMIELLIEDLQGEGCLNMTREEIGNFYERRIKLAEESE